jgi:type I restriction enzyme, S subunit
MRTGWNTRTLDQISTNLDSRRVPITKGARKSGEYPYYGASGIVDYVAHYIFDEDALLVSEDGANLLARSTPIAFPASGKYWVNNHAHILKFTSLTTQRFVELYLESIPLDEYITGAAQPKLNQKALNSIPIPVPPLADQQRIVALLDEALESIATVRANAEKNIQNARALFESHIQSAFTQRGPAWANTTLGEIGKISMCKRIFKEETTATGDIPFYKIGTFGKQPDAFIFHQTYSKYRAKYPFPKKGDVLISASGTIGRRVRYDGEPAYFQDSNIVWIENDEKQLLNDYLYHFYEACEWNSTEGATIPRLYNDDLRRVAIAFPKSLQEQRQIVAQLDALSYEAQRLARVYEQKLAALDALKKSLLHQAFTGDL